jgi:hypothetical protein
VHRSTRGWSYGGGVTDPRTGEIIKGNVLLGSLRIRQDVLLARGLMAQYDALDPKTSPSIMALARIRQLSAHEVGHTLGLDHNMAASTNNRASVMDYPAPYVKIVNGALDLSDAYARGVGPYDIAAIRYTYQQVANDAELDTLAKATPLFISDPHSRPVGGAHPLGSVWDNGGDPVSMLRHEIEVRRIALEQFGTRNIAHGQPFSALEEALLPLYLHHRYQLEAAAKSIGGVFFTYSVKESDASTPIQTIVPPQAQRETLALVVSTLEPRFLDIPRRIIDLIPPPSYAHGDANTELFPRRTDPVFDPIAAAMTSADITVAALLDPARSARLTQQPDNLTMRDVTDALLNAALQQGAIPRATRTLIMTRLAELANNREAAPQVRAEASDALRRLSARLAAPVADAAEGAHRRATRDEIERFLARPETWQAPVIPTVPPGPPI